MSAKRSSMHMTISDRTQSNRERATLATDVNISAKFAETTNNALVNCSRGTTLCMLLLHFRPNVNKEKKHNNTKQQHGALQFYAIKCAIKQPVYWLFSASVVLPSCSRTDLWCCSSAAWSLMTILSAGHRFTCISSRIHVS